MTRVFHIASDLGPTAAAKQLALLAPALPAEQFSQTVGLLGSGEPFATTIAATGIPVVSCPIRHAIDAHGLAAVARAIREFRPNLVHAWGPLAARVAALLDLPLLLPRPKPALIISACTGSGPGPAEWLVRRALRSARTVTADTHSAADRIRRATGVTVTHLPPAVAPAAPPSNPSAIRSGLDVPAAARLVLAAGQFDAIASLREAVWAFDVLKYTARDLYLVLVGDGPDRDRLLTFGRESGFADDRVRYTGLRTDVAAIVGLAEVAWVTHARGGVNFALEAMAAGVPVVAMSNPDMAEVVTDGATGRLVPAADRIRLAAVTGDLLDDPTARARLGAAGRVEVQARFPVVAVVERLAAVYHDVTTAAP